MVNKYTFTIDWEDFSQLFAKYTFGEIKQPLKDIERQSKIILDILDFHEVKGTFFILGILAQFRPDLVKEIQNKGHEIALHGFYHQNLNDISYEKIKEDIFLSKQLVEEIIGEKVYGYRAPFFSLTKNRLGTLDILADLGFLYDSSIMPADISKFGIANFSNENLTYKLKNNLEIIELPATTASFFGKEIPVSGGSYIRILPSFFLNRNYERFKKAKKNVMLYMHPYEFDTEPLDVSANFPSNHGYPSWKVWLYNIRWNVFRKTILPKMSHLLTNNEFITCLELAESVKETTTKKQLIY